MKNFIIKLTNSCNNDENVNWGFFDSEEEQNAWVSENEKKRYVWNYETQGANSFRYYDFQYLTPENILNCSLSEFESMTLRDFLPILKKLL